jgi:hypothetical protein
MSRFDAEELALLHLVVKESWLSTNRPPKTRVEEDVRIAFRVANAGRNAAGLPPLRIPGRHAVRAVIGGIDSFHSDLARYGAEEAVRQLVRHGLIERTGPWTDATMSNLMAKEDVDPFLSRFRAKGVPADRPGPGMHHVIDAAPVTKRKVTDIVRLVLDGDLGRLELLDEEMGLKSVVIDPDEVVRVLDAREARGRVPIGEAATRLQLKKSGMRALIAGRRRDGRPHLRAFVSGDPARTQTSWFDPLDLDAFAADHVDLAALAEERGLSTDALQRQLDDAEIAPILPRDHLNRLVFRRSDP